MALRWYLGDVKNNAAWRKATKEWPDEREISQEDRDNGIEILHPGTEQLIWATMAVGMSNITEKNYLEFAARCKMYEELRGKMNWHNEESAKFWTEMDKEFGFEWHDGESWVSNIDLIHANIGLSTNASSETRAQFVSRITKLFKEDHERFMERKLKEA